MVRPSFSSIVEVKIGGAKLPDTIAPMLTDGWVDQGVNVPAAFRLTFRDPYHRLLGKLNVQFGTKVVITPIADGHGKGNPLLTGEVTGLETDYDGTGSFTVIRGYDYGHRLMRQRRVAAYRNQKASDIARKLVAMDGVSIGRIQATKGTYGFISQSNVTDWDFLARLADENKMIMYLDSKGKFPFVTPKPSAGAPSPNTDGDKSTFVLQAGHDILRLRAGRHRRRPDRQGRVAAAGTSPPRRRSPRPRRPPPTRASASSGLPGTAAGKFKLPANSSRPPTRTTSRTRCRTPRRPSAFPTVTLPPSPSWRSPPTATPTCGPASPSRSPTSAPPSRASTPSPRYATTSATASPTSPGSRSADASGVPCTASPRAAAAARTRRAPPGCPASPTPSSPTYRTPSSRAGSSCSSRGWTTPTSATGRAASRWAAWRAAASSPWTSATRCWSPSTGGHWTTRS
ncbi:hypothetical protein SVIOM342S_06869 [Streptomyces violaceorubidus]